MCISDKVKKIPGGAMLIPLLCSCVLNTFFPTVMNIGNPTTALFTSKGTMMIVGLLLVFSGIQIDIKTVRRGMKRSGVLILAKLFLDVAASIACLKLFGMDGIGGVSTLAIVSCVCSCNAGLYLTLMKQYGDEGDLSGFALMNITGLPFIPVCILTFSRETGIDWASIAATCIPFALGILLGAVDRSLKEKTKAGTALLIPFLGLCLGSSINLKTAMGAVGGGLFLFLITLMVNNLSLYLIERFLLKSTGYVAMAASAAAGLALAVPSLAAEANASYAPYLEQAVSQIALVVLLSAIVTPLLTERFRDRNRAAE